MKRFGIIGATLSVAAALAGAAIASGGHHSSPEVGGFGGSLPAGAHPVTVWQEPASSGGAPLQRVACASADAGASCYSR